ncbi:MAG: hypothetical protein K6C33_12280 [Desulfovibrio sp.]|nr:hypothetical protein [Desulfovibrio sp.]
MPLRFGLYRFGRGCAFAPGFDASPDPSRETLDLVLEGAKPRGWIAGHWHEREDWMLGRLECHVLDMVKGGAGLREVPAPSGLPAALAPRGRSPAEPCPAGRHRASRKC